MELFSNLAMGFSTALTFSNLLYCLIGTLLGTLIGVLPGIGPAATIAVLLPVTFTMDPTAGLIMMAGIFYGAQYGGSTTAILINLPGEASSAVTSIDGYRMAQQGRAGTALGIAAIGSFVAGSIATLLIAAFSPYLADIALKFGAPEYFSLMVLGLIGAVALARGSALKALAMVVLGLLFGIVGTDIYTGVPRFTYGILDLSDGISVVAAAVGVFGVAEILRNLEDESDREVGIKKISSIFPSLSDLKQSVGPILRGTGIGSVLGILPGGGAVLAAFGSYAMEKKIAADPASFGNGAIQGVAGPESANNAAAQTSFIPMLTLGIPGNTVMALMVGAMTVQGIVPGPNIINERPELFWGLIASMWVGNLMLVILNLPLIGIWIKLLSIPYKVLFPSIIAFSTIGAYMVAENAFDVYTVAAFGVLGYVLTRLNCEPAPLLLGFVLGPMLEQYFRRALIVGRGDFSIFVTKPISAALLLTAVASLILVLTPKIARKREVIFVED